jgi:beta-galactosidase
MLGDQTQALLPDFDDSDWITLDLPHDWSIEGEFSSEHPAGNESGALPDGIGWYRKTFVVSKSEKGKCFFIDFDGIYWNSAVWINGNLLGTHPDGYISFRYDLTPHIRFDDKNVIAIRVDNSEQLNSQWHSGSGIFGNVWLTVTNPVHIANRGTYITTKSVDNMQATIVIHSTIENFDTLDKRVEIIHTLYDKTGRKLHKVIQDTVLLAKQKTETEKKITVKNPRLWELDDPYLYTVVTEIFRYGKILDRYEMKTGIRTFEFDFDRGFILNGNTVPIVENMINVSLANNGSIVGTDNGDPADYTSFKRLQRKLFNSNCLVVIKSEKKPCNIKLLASGEGLKPTELTLTCKKF